MKSTYQGEAYSVEGIIKMLRSRGLSINDEERAAQVLTNVSYSRLKHYMTPLMQDRSRHIFKKGADFEDAYALYGFDRRLRELIFHELEKVEVSIRTHIAYACNGNEKGYWFLNPEYFKSETGHERILKHIKYEIERTDNEGIIEFRKKYDNDYPPSWLTLEATSMGTLWTIYDELSDESLRRRISSYYHMPPRVFSSWIKHLVAVRNNCAHHNRVWDNAPSTKAILPEGLDRSFPEMVEDDRYHIYMTLCIIKYFIDCVKPDNSFTMRLKLLIGNFQIVSPSQMGFPENWLEHPLWH